MQNIGIVLKTTEKGNVFKDFFRRFRYKILPVNEYGFNFIVVDDSANWSRIFNKNNVKNAVVLTDKKIDAPELNILDGNTVYFQMLPDVVRKLLKSINEHTVVALSCKTFQGNNVVLAETLCKICNSMIIVTENISGAEEFCENIMDKYGAVAEVTEDATSVHCHVAVVLDTWGKKFSDNCIIIDKNGATEDKTINDFYIPFKIKPPYKMSNLVFAECVESIK